MVILKDNLVPTDLKQAAPVKPCSVLTEHKIGVGPFKPTGGTNYNMTRRHVVVVV